jgi:hypothetical protein
LTAGADHNQRLTLVLSVQVSPEEEAGIEAALESCRQGRVVDATRAREIIDAALGR